MYKRLMALVLTVLMFSGLACVSADNTIIANLGDVQAGVYIDQLIGTTGEGSASVSAGSLPSGCEIVSEQRESGAMHYLRGTPSLAGTYEFTLSVAGADGSSTTLTCVLNVTPFRPVVTPCPSVSLFSGAIGEVSVSAVIRDGGSLSYQWYTNSYASTENGMLVDGGDSDRLPIQGGSFGTVYYYCVVTNSNNGQRVSVTSEPIAVTVSEATVTSISISQMPSKTSFKKGDKLDYLGLQVLATYSDGSTRTINSPDLQLSPLTLDKEGAQEITVSYRGAICNYSVLVDGGQDTVKSLSVLSMPTKTDYAVGDTLNSAGLILRATMANGSSQDLSSGFVCTPNAFLTEGSQTVTVTYGGASCTFVVNVKGTSENVESIAVSVMPQKLNYTVGEKLNTTGLVIMVQSSNVSREIVDGFSCQPTTLSSAGTQEITVSYQGKTCSFYVTVLEDSSATPVPSQTQRPDSGTPKKSGHSSTLTVVVLVVALLAFIALITYSYVIDRERMNAFLGRFRGKGSNKRK